MLGNLGWNALEIGDYAVAHDSLTQALAIYRSTGSRSSEGWLLVCLALLHLLKDDPLAAQHYAAAALTLAQSTGDQHTLGEALIVLGHAQTALSNYNEALTTYQEALAVWGMLNVANRILETRTSIARLWLAQGNLPAAYHEVEAILPDLSPAQVTGADQPLLLFLTCFDVLQAADDPRATAVLHTAYHMLQERAAMIADADTRRSYLERVAAHRRLLQAWATTRLSITATC
ncbi:MAG: tetratricopeptide repeat protein [Chloroflexaceae bacterium]|nr:tetratricopeptide repeat protein [Chloroflexaceae bacterium]